MSDPVLTIRIIFVGNTNVGKTALNTRFLSDTFTQDNSSTLTPTSSNITYKTLDGTEVILQLWDTAGQERFQSLSQVFYRDANIAIICVDASAPDTYDTVKIWKDRVIEHEKNCHCVIAITKVDLAADKRVELVQLCNKLTQENQISEYYMTSSKTGEGVKEMFGSLATIGAKEMKQSGATVTAAKANAVNIETKVDKKKKKKAGC